MMKFRSFLFVALVSTCGFLAPSVVDAQGKDHGRMRLVLAEKVMAVRLARIKTQDAAANLVQTRANNASRQIASLEKAREMAEKQRDRKKALHLTRATSIEDVDEAEAKLVQAKIALDAPRAVIAEAEAELQLIAARKNELLAEIEESRAGIEFLRMQMTPK